MKKAILFMAALSLNILLSCYSTDPKNEEEPYPTYDTTRPMEHINDADTTSDANMSNSGLRKGN